MSEKHTPLAIARHMLENDAFSRWMGVEIVEADAGKSLLKMEIRDNMTNGFGVTHGGIIFALADSALAFAAGSHGRVSLALDNKISYVKTSHTGDLLTAKAVEEHLGRQIGVYNITITNQAGKTTALMRGTVFRTNTQVEL